MNAAVHIDPLRHYREQFDAIRGTHAAGSAARDAAFARFEQLGFPGARDEAWKYTSLRRLENRAFAASDRAAAHAATLPPLSELGAPRVVLVNGHVRADRSGTLQLPDGVRVQVGGDRLSGPTAIERSARVSKGGGTERFAALNAALTADPVLIDVDASAGPDASLHIVCLASGAAAEVSHPRISLRVSTDARLRLILEYQGDDSVERWVNAVVDIELAAGASLRLYRLQRQGTRTFQTERIDADVAANARLDVHDTSLGAMLARLDLNVALSGPGATTELSGLFFADGSRHLDTHVHVDHRSGAATSVQDYRGIAADRGRGVFNTKVVVFAGAQQSNARQSSRNLLLTPGAEIDTKPELEIYADDVQCGHGATTGQLDPHALFYLQSRGLSADDARRVLTRAFAASILRRMDFDAYAELVHAQLDSRLERLLETVA